MPIGPTFFVFANCTIRYLYSIMTSLGTFYFIDHTGNLSAEVSRNKAYSVSHEPNAAILPTTATLSPTLVLSQLTLKLTSVVMTSNCVFRCVYWFLKTFAGVS